MLLNLELNTVHKPGEQASAQRKRRKYYRSARRRVRNGCRAAVMRALSGARRYLNGEVPTLDAAAAWCGSNVTYVRAAVILIKSENTVLMRQVLGGEYPLLAAARDMQKLAELVTAFRRAPFAARVAFARTVGPSTLFDNTLVPAL
jgi:hypothetical protein